MLVDSIKLMDAPEKVIVSSVWTDSVDKIFGLFGKSLCFSGRFGFVDFLIPKDREIIPWIGNLNAARKLTGQVVKGGSEIVGHIAKQEPNLGVNSRNVTQDELRSIRFRIELGNACVSVGTDEGRVGNNILEGQRNRWPS